MQRERSHSGESASGAPGKEAGGSSAAGRIARSAPAWLGLAMRLAAAAIWLVAGIAKLPAIESFRIEVERYLILPNALSIPFAYVLPFFEIGLGLYLAVGLFVRGSGFVGTLLMAVFIAAQIQAWARGLSIDCGCFGSLAQSRVGLATVARDFALGIPTFIMLARPARLLSLDKLLFHREDGFAGARNSGRV